MLRVEGVSKRLGGREILTDITCPVGAGEHVAVLGPNGAGKSTLLKLVTGVWRPDTGTVRIDGYAPRHRAGRLQLGAVFQDSTVDPYMSARETLRMHGVLYGLSGSTLAERCESALHEVDMITLAGRQNRTLSGGQLRRLELARCLVHRAGLIVLDEPTSGLDPLARESLWQTVDRLRARHGVAVLATTHHFEEISRCTRVYQLRTGRLEEARVTDRDTFAASFAG